MFFKLFLCFLRNRNWIFRNNRQLSSLLHTQFADSIHLSSLNTLICSLINRQFLRSFVIFRFCLINKTQRSFQLFLFDVILVITLSDTHALVKLISIESTHISTAYSLPSLIYISLLAQIDRIPVCKTGFEHFLLTKCFNVL